MRLVKRSEFGWGASAAARATPTKGLVIHYDGSKQGLATKSHAACVDYWKRTRKFHMGPSRGWADIGYSFGACPHGYVFEGRGLNRQQAAQPGGNSTWYSVTLMSGPGEAPTTEQINAVRELRAYLMDRGVAGGVKGHRDFYATDCPGGVLYAMVKDGTFAKKPDNSAITTPTTSTWTEQLVKNLPLVGLGDDNYDVKTVRACLFARGRVPADKFEKGGLKAWLEDTKADKALDDLIRAFQRAEGLDADGIVGPKTWPRLMRIK